MQVLPPFLVTKGEFNRKAQEKTGNIINTVEFQLSHIPGYTLLDGNKENYFSVSFLKLPASVCTGSERGQVEKIKNKKEAILRLPYTWARIRYISLLSS